MRRRTLEAQADKLSRLDYFHKSTEAEDIPDGLLKK